MRLLSDALIKGKLTLRVSFPPIRYQLVNEGGGNPDTVGYQQELLLQLHMHPKHLHLRNELCETGFLNHKTGETGFSQSQVYKKTFTLTLKSLLDH